MASASHLARITAVAVGATTAGALVAIPGPAIGLVGVMAAGVMFLVVLTQMLIRWPDDPEARTRILRWTMASLVLHLAVGLIITNSDALVLRLGPDAIGYHAAAKGILAHWSNGSPLPIFGAGKEGYYYMLAALYWVLGPSTWGAVALNAVMAAALVPIVSDTTRRLFGADAARYVPVLLLLVPGLVIWPSQVLKEAPFLLLLGVAANCSSRLVERYSAQSLLVLVLLLPVMLWFRAQLGLAVVAGILGGIVLGRRNLAVGIAGGLTAGALVAAALTLGVGSSGYKVAISTNLQQADSVRRGFATGVGSGFAAEADVSSTRRAFTFLPKGLFLITFGPFPWQLRAAQAVVVPDVIAWWVLIIAFWRGQRSARSQGRQWLALAVPAAAVMVVIALSVGNYGTVVRERVQALVLLTPVIALGLAERRAERSTETEPALAS